MRKVLLLVSLVALAACSRGEANSTVQGGSRTFTVGAFDSVSLAGSDDVHVVRGPAVAVVASGPQTVLDKLDIHVAGSTLNIGRKRDMWGTGWSAGRGAVITVTVPAIVAASVAGSGDMSVDRVDGSKFEGTVAGSGALQLEALAVQTAKLTIGGSGNLVAAGTAGDSDLSVGGSGSLDVRKLLSRTATVSIGGSGNVRAAASETATISIAGSGDATVTGTDKCTISKVGSGEARCSR